MALLLKILPVRRLGFWGTWGIVLLSNILILLLRGRAKQGLDRKKFCRVVLIQGKDRVELDAIVDTGNSLDFTYRHLLSKEPASLKICTFLDKPERRKPGITLKPDYVGYTVPNEFVVGYGLDFNEHYRNLPYIGVLKPEAYEG